MNTKANMNIFYKTYFKQLRFTLFRGQSFMNNRRCSTLTTNNNGEAKKIINNDLMKRLQIRIKLSGPLTVADYMKEVLTDPISGYYMKKDVFGTKGDFITSPEISQMFGELIGIWCVNEWMRCGQPDHFQVVELGPGRGTLADDMLRVFSKFEIRKSVKLCMVEISPKLSSMQQQKLSSYKQTSSILSDKSPYMASTSRYDIPVEWYKTLHQVPRGIPSFFVAHEFFDALPVHKFQKKDGKWREILVDSNGDDKLRFIISEMETVASKVLLKNVIDLDSTGSSFMDSEDMFIQMGLSGSVLDGDGKAHAAVHPSETRKHLELCPLAGVIVQEIATRLDEDGGFALIADYGHTGEKTDTFRAFKDHKLHDPLIEPGTADLTADVDFSYLKSLIRNKVICHGPINQNMFLSQMGIQQRLQVLMKNSDSEYIETLISQYEMLLNPEQMGVRFKFLALLHASVSREYNVPGFNMAPVNQIINSH